MGASLISEAAPKTKLISEFSALRVWGGGGYMRDLADVSDIFYFCCSGRGKGIPRPPGRGGIRFFIENPRRAGGGLQEGEGPRGPGVCLRRMGILGAGGGAKYFFSGSKCLPR